MNSTQRFALSLMLMALFASHYRDVSMIYPQLFSGVIVGVFAVGMVLFMMAGKDE